MHQFHWQQSHDFITTMLKYSVPLYFWSMWPNNSIFLSFDYYTFLQKASSLSMWSAADFSCVWRCWFWSRGFFLGWQLLSPWQFKNFLKCKQCFNSLYLVGPGLFLSNQFPLSWRWQFGSSFRPWQSGYTFHLFVLVQQTFFYIVHEEAGICRQWLSLTKTF